MNKDELVAKNKLRRQEKSATLAAQQNTAAVDEATGEAETKEAAEGEAEGETAVQEAVTGVNDAAAKNPAAGTGKELSPPQVCHQVHLRMPLLSNTCTSHRSTL